MRYLLAGRSLVLDPGLCNGCGRCEEVCPHAVFTVSDRTAFISDRDACMECGACAMNCPVDAIQVSPGVGCAVAVINGLRTGQESCDCGCDC